MAAFVLLACLWAQDLPQAPEDVRLREVVKLGPDSAEYAPVRIQPHPKSHLLYVLYLNGDLWQVDPSANAKMLIMEGKQLLRRDKYKNVQVLGFHIDAAGLAYVVANERHSDERPQRAHVVVYRVADTDGDHVPDKVSEYLTFDHPWGVGPYNHGACHIATGPDGLIYLGVGSRTDHGETGKDPTLDTGGETALTAVMLRFDPRKERPVTEVFCRGLRNPYGFDWDDQSRLVAGEHGPDAHHPEELNWLRQGKHYGFPYRFGNHAAPMYPDAVATPPGMTFERPIANLGPDGRPSAEPEYTFHPHSAPTGMLFYRKGSLPERYNGGYFLTRFGNFLGKTSVGFDVLHIRLEDDKEGGLAARIQVFVDKLRRPIDICQLKGNLYILEYTSYDRQRLSRVVEAAGR